MKNDKILNRLVSEIIFIGIVLICGSSIKRTIKETCPNEYNQSIKEMPFYLRWGENEIIK